MLIVYLCVVSGKSSIKSLLSYFRDVNTSFDPNAQQVIADVFFVILNQKKKLRTTK